MRFLHLQCAAGLAQQIIKEMSATMATNIKTAEEALAIPDLAKRKCANVTKAMKMQMQQAQGMYKN